MTASNQPSGSDIGTLFALYREWAELPTSIKATLNLEVDGSGRIVDWAHDKPLIYFDSAPDAISKLRAAIEAAAPKPAEVREPDGYCYVEAGNEATGKWERLVDKRDCPIRYKHPAMANDWMTFEAKRCPHTSFRLADSNGQPLSPVFTVSQLSADELGKLGALDIDRIYEGE